MSAGCGLHPGLLRRQDSGAGGGAGLLGAALVPGFTGSGVGGDSVHHNHLHPEVKLGGCWALGCGLVSCRWWFCNQQGGIGCWWRISAGSLKLFKVEIDLHLETFGFPLDNRRSCYFLL